MTRVRARDLVGAVDDVAPSLLGPTLVVRSETGLRRVRLVEVEAYGGADDPASHAYRGPTPRCAVMFGPPARLYVYRSYGVHWCANVVTGPDGRAGAVLLRAAEVLDERGRSAELLRGPGLLTRYLDLTGDDSGVSLVGGRRAWLLTGSNPSFVATPRVGLSRGTERAWRFVLEGHRLAGRRVASRVSTSGAASGVDRGAEDPRRAARSAEGARGVRRH